jgi:hypothetical protein
MLALGRTDFLTHKRHCFASELLIKDDTLPKTIVAGAAQAAQTQHHRNRFTSDRHCSTGPTGRADRALKLQGIKISDVEVGENASI